MDGTTPDSLQILSVSALFAQMLIANDTTFDGIVSVSPIWNKGTPNRQLIENSPFPQTFYG